MSNNKKIYEVLTQADYQNPLWKKLAGHFRECRDNHRCSNDSTVLTETETAALRGRIAGLNDLLEETPLSAMFEDDIPDVT